MRRGGRRGLTARLAVGQIAERVAILTLLRLLQRRECRGGGLLVGGDGLLLLLLRRRGLVGGLAVARCVRVCVLLILVVIHVGNGEEKEWKVVGSRRVGYSRVAMSRRTTPHIGPAARRVSGCGEFSADAAGARSCWEGRRGRTSTVPDACAECEAAATRWRAGREVVGVCGME